MLGTLPGKQRQTQSLWRKECTQEKKLFSEKVEDEPIQDRRNQLKVNVYNYILDVFVGQFEHCFKDFKQMAKLFAILSPKRFKMPDADENILALAEFYSEDISSP